MNIQLVAIDMDGTLLNDDHQIGERTKKVIEQLKTQGIKIVLASGRGPRSCDPYLEELALSNAIITHNGAVIYEHNPPRTVIELGFEASELRPIIEYCRKNDIHFDLNTAFEMYAEHIPPGAEEVYQQFFVSPNKVEDASTVEDPIVKFTMSGTEEQLDQVQEEVVSQFPEWKVMRSGETFIDVIHPQATKGNALQMLMDEFNIPADDVLAIGNYFNDLEMIQLAGIGVAMDNAPQGLKDQADRVTASNNEEGVALVLEELMDKQALKI